MTLTSLRQFTSDESWIMSTSLENGWLMSESYTKSACVCLFCGKRMFSIKGLFLRTLQSRRHKYNEGRWKFFIVGFGLVWNDIQMSEWYLVVLYAYFKHMKENRHNVSIELVFVLKIESVLICTGSKKTSRMINGKWTKK